MMGIRLFPCFLVLAVGCTNVAQPTDEPSAETTDTLQAWQADGWYTKVPPLSDQERREYELGGGWRPFPANPTREQAHEALLKAPFFAAGGVGYGGEEPGALLGFRRVLSEPDAAAAFEDLIRRADLPGQMYGLCGLYLTDPVRFAHLVKPYLSDQRLVRVIEGCISRRQVVSLVVKQPNGITLRKGESYGHYVDRNVERDANESLDIVGGALPSVMDNRGKATTSKE